MPVSDAMSAYLNLLAEVEEECFYQNDKWGEQNHLDGTGSQADKDRAAISKAKCQANTPVEDNWRDVLDEEVTEAFAESDPVLLRAELIQVAAVAVQWISAIDRRMTS
jgi:hypothetical protein